MQRLKLFIKKVLLFLDPRKWTVYENPQYSATRATVPDNGGLKIDFNFKDYPKRIWGKFFTKKGALKSIEDHDDDLSSELDIVSVDDSVKTITISGRYT